MKKQTWKKLKPIGNYWLEIETDTPYRIVLHRKDGGTWSDSVRAMSHLMNILADHDRELVEGIANNVKNRLSECKQPVGYSCEYCSGLNDALIIAQEFIKKGKI